jgi:polysaccharide export outer membrane protein
MASATTTLDDSAFSVKFNYALIDLSPDVLAHIPTQDLGSVYASFGAGDGPAPEIRVGVGDVLSVAVFEAASGGLFIPVEAGSRPGNFVTLPAQTVDRSGTISVPYAGQVQAADRSLPQIQREIEMRLANRAIEPQVVLSFVEQRAADVSVLGDVNAPTTLTVRPGGDRVLDLISRAGGARFDADQTLVTLQRRGRSATVLLSRLLEQPRENIFVAPGDTIFVKHNKRQYIAVGASGTSGLFDFETARLNLAEAVARAGGLLDDRADPARTFVYRIEDRRVVERMGADLSMFPAEQRMIPTIYRANMRDPSSFFVAKSFSMRDKDLVYISNADSVEVTKLLSIINQVSSTISGVSTDVVRTRDAGRALRN